MEKTLGEKRVRTDFNTTKNDVVTILKNRTADLIDICQGMRSEEASAVPDETPAEFNQRCGEKLRLIALAQTAYEEAAMWAVKAATIELVPVKFENAPKG